MRRWDVKDEDAAVSRIAGSLAEAAARGSRVIRGARAARGSHRDGDGSLSGASRGSTGGESPAGAVRPRPNAVGPRTARSAARIAGGGRVRSAGAVPVLQGGPKSRRPIEAVPVPPVPRPLAVSAAYAWRALIVAVAVYAVYTVLLRLELVFIALFLALVFSSLLRPGVRLLNRILPRSLAVLITLLGSAALLGSLFWGVGVTVSDDSTALTNDFRGGLARIQTWLQGPPFHVRAADLSGLQQKLTSFIAAHQATLINQAVSEAGTVVEIFTVLALAVFCSVFFMHSGERMWYWFEGQLPESAQPVWNRCGQAAWRTFAGYARGTIIIAGTNAILVGISLYVLGVPLALPLTVLEFFLSFIPLAGSPIAMAVATVVALAGRGVTAAIIVLVLIVVIGQIEGHVLQPLVMSWSVRLHPVAVALSVICGGIVAGFLGAVVAVPLVSILWAVLGEVRRPPDPADDLETSMTA
jgi:predicted PurR-regulated permease PerM